MKVDGIKIMKTMRKTELLAEGHSFAIHTLPLFKNTPTPAHSSFSAIYSLSAFTLIHFQYTHASFTPYYLLSLHQNRKSHQNN